MGAFQAMDGSTTHSHAIDVDGTPNALSQAATLVAGGDPALLGIVALSLRVSLTAVAIAAVIALPLGALLAMLRFPGRGLVVALLNALMGLPPVLVGLIVYLSLSRAGPLGPLGLLFTPGAMIIAQAILVAPILAALTREVIAGLWEEYAETLRSMRVPFRRALPTVLWDARFALTTVLLAGFGRAAAEVGAVLIVGGNIDGVTRTMTTAIALETQRGDLPLALALGLVLLAVVLGVNAAAQGVRALGTRLAG